ncbi:LIM domain-containing protein [Purpureocillium lilacinum]|uniref:LIM domain-containing protein n=1 Tax=Purpureocillium lilacinum TaxID=33203 RepID=A0A179GVY6_PURLI|nr:LIM domain-containing protein [Purpureocillium lilacinum]
MRKAADAKTRRASPPTASYMSNDQFASYLSELRANRTTRPGGARPLPSQLSRASTGRYSLGGASAQDAAINDASHQRTPSQAPSVAAASIRSRLSTSSGRDYYPATSTAPLKPSDVVPTRTYMERGQRWMEKEEAVSLRDAMEEMDIRSGAQDGSGSGSGSDDETRLYNAALDEAAELVWQHQNGVVPRPPDGPYRYRPHLRKNSYAHARTASIGADSDDVAPSGLRRDMGSRSVSGSSTGSDGSSYAPRHSLDSNQCAGNRKQKPYGSVGAHNRRTSLKRNISGEVERPFSGDQIWEEPEVSGGSEGVASGRASPNKLSNKPPNPVSSSRFFPSRDAAAQVKPLNRVDIYRNPPTQTRNAQYTRNTPSPGPGPTPDPSVPRKNGMEVRSDDIRAATSRRLKDRSSRLPEPTAVSDSPGRPIPKPQQATPTAGPVGLWVSLLSLWKRKLRRAHGRRHGRAFRQSL